jgi:Saxitoxin biosynthesis operon protein SxtJ
MSERLIRSQQMMELFKTKITKDQSKDTGMAMVLVLLLLYLSLKQNGFLVGAIAALVIDMTVPQLYRPVASVWLGVSQLLGIVVSKVILSVVFFCVVTPVGVVRRLSGKDSLRTKTFKASDKSVMKERNHTFVPADMEKPY